MNERHEEKNALDIRSKIREKDRRSFRMVFNYRGAIRSRTRKRESARRALINFTNEISPMYGGCLEIVSIIRLNLR